MKRNEPEKILLLPSSLHFEMKTSLFNVCVCVCVNSHSRRVDFEQSSVMFLLQLRLSGR